MSTATSLSHASGSMPMSASHSSTARPKRLLSRAISARSNVSLALSSSREASLSKLLWKLGCTSVTPRFLDEAPLCYDTGRNSRVGGCHLQAIGSVLAIGPCPALVTPLRRRDSLERSWSLALSRIPIASRGAVRVGGGHPWPSSFR